VKCAGRNPATNRAAAPAAWRCWRREARGPLRARFPAHAPRSPMAVTVRVLHAMNRSSESYAKSGDVHIAHRVFGHPVGGPRECQSRLDNPGSLVAPLASHEEGGPRDTAITGEQLSAKDNCLAGLVWRRSMLRIGGPNLILPLATGPDARPQGGMNSAGRGRDPTDCGLARKARHVRVRPALWRATALMPIVGPTSGNLNARSHRCRCVPWRRRRGHFHRREADRAGAPTMRALPQDRWPASARR